MQLVQAVQALYNWSKRAWTAQTIDPSLFLLLVHVVQVKYILYAYTRVGRVAITGPRGPLGPNPRITVLVA